MSSALRIEETFRKFRIRTQSCNFPTDDDVCVDKFSVTYQQPILRVLAGERL